MSVELTPITRIEEYLDGIVNGGTVPQEDVTRIETFLDCIYNNEVCALTPVTRIETYLAKISGADVVLPDAPVTRIEMYLASIAGEDVVIPDEPVTRIEEYLAEWAEGGNIPWVTLTGAIVSFTAPRSHALKEVVVDIEPQQDLHGYDSPWPAGGGGVNKLQVVADSATINDITFTVQKDLNGNVTGIKCAGTASAAAQFQFNTNIPLNAGVTYRAYAGSSALTSGIITFQICKGDNWATVVSADGQYGRSSTFEAESGTVYKARIYVWSGQTVDVTIKPMVVVNTDAFDLPFAPYSNICPISGWTGCEIHVADGETPHVVDNEYDVTWQTEAGTVYGGTLTVKEDGSGSVELTHKLYTFTGNETFEIVSNTQVETFDYFRWYSSSFTNVISDWNRYQDTLMSCYKTEDQLDYWYSGGVGKTAIMWTVKGVAGICFRNDNYTDANTFKASLVGQTMYYKLATPITYTLTQQQVITALQGVNNVWADTGDVTVTFRGTPIVEPDEQPLQALNLLLGGAYRNNQTAEDVSDEEALDILMGGAR